MRDLLQLESPASLWVLGLLVKGTLLLAGTAMLALVLRHASAALRHLVWGTAIVAVLALPLVSLALPWRWRVVPLAALLVPAPAMSADQTTSAAVPDPRALSTAIAKPSGGDAAPVMTPAPGTAPDAATQSSGTRLTLLAGLLAVWGIGALYLLGRLALGGIHLVQVVRRATTLDTPDWRRPLLEVADRLALSSPPRLVLSERLPMPFACGLVRPAIVLPAGAAEWDDRRRRAVLFHELAHLSRFDLVVNALGQLACALYWFHPLVWVAARRLRVESERACDDLVLGVGTRASEYADHLLQIVCRASRSRTPAVALPMAQRHEFEGRMLAILERGARREPASRRHAMLLGGFALAVLVPLAALAPAAPARAEEPVVEHTQAVPLPVPVPSPAASEERREKAAPAESRVPTAPVQGTDSVGVVAALVRALQDSVASVREDAAYALGQLAAKAAIEPLVARLTRDPAAKVREMAAWSLGQIGSRKATAALGAAAQADASEDVRAMTVWALGQLEDPASVPALTALLRDKSVEVRGRAAWALGSIEPAGAPPELLAALGDPSPDVRLRAAWALGQIGDAASVTRLAATLKDSSSEVRRAAMWALGQVGGDAAEGALLQALEDTDPEVRARAARALGGSHGDPWPWPWPMPIIR